jgi:hypothetical protein
MVSSFLACAVEGDLGISHLGVGPVEIRLLFIAINSWLAAGGRAPLAAILPVAIMASAVALFSLIARTQRRLWRADRRATITLGTRHARSPIGNRDRQSGTATLNRYSPIVSRENLAFPLVDDRLA